MNHPYIEVARLDLPATYTSLNLLRACLAELLMLCDVAEQDPAMYGVQLAAHETCANVIDHAYGGDFHQRIAVTLSLCRAERRIVVELHDTGSAFAFDDVPSPNLDEPQEHGYGLFLIRSVMDEVVYQSTSDGNNWRLVKHF